MNKLSILQHGRLLYLILLSCVAVNLEARPQNDERISLGLENVTLKKALDAIEEQSVYLFFNKGVDLSRQVSISVTNETIEDICEILFVPIRVSYTIDGTQIFITKAQEITVSGTVRDVSGLPVPGAAAGIFPGTSRPGHRQGPHRPGGHRRIGNSLDPVPNSGTGLLGD